LPLRFSTLSPLLQRGWKTEGAIENGQCREGGKPKGQSRMDNVERVEKRRGNREWTMQREWTLHCPFSIAPSVVHPLCIVHSRLSLRFSTLSTLSILDCPFGFPRREGGKPKGQSRMDNAESVENRRGNREWTMQRGWKTEGAIENGQCREGENMGHKSHNE
jgi:hypothetical protein